LADAETLLALFGGGDSWREEAAADAREALALDDSLAEAHTSLAAVSVLNWNWDEAEQEFTRALELNPNNAQTHHWYGNLYLVPKGRHKEAIAELQRALDLDPLSLVISTDLGVAYFLDRQYDAAYSQYQKVLATDADFLPVHYQLVAYFRQRQMHRREIEEMIRNAQLAGRPLIAQDILHLSSDRQRLFQTMAATGGNFGHPAEYAGSSPASVEAYLMSGEKKQGACRFKKCLPQP
jgi:tetratricopeptide (TPR) repeat protein